MPSGLDPKAAALITGASAAEASFFSIPYVSALQRCVSCAYGPSLDYVLPSAGLGRTYGDEVTKDIVRCRLEAERAAAEELTTAILEPPSASTPIRAEHRLTHENSVDMECAAAAADGSANGGNSAAAGSRPHSTAAASRSCSRNSSVKSSRQMGGKPFSSTLPARTTSCVDASAKDDGLAKFNFFKPEMPFLLSSAPVNSRYDGAALLLLRFGLCRALGWPIPLSLQSSVGAAVDAKDGRGVPVHDNSGRCLATEVSDALLTRYSYPNVVTAQAASLRTMSTSNLTGDSESSSTCAHMYMRLPDVELRQSLILEWMEDVLLFTHYQSFSALQTQCVVLDALLVLNKIDGDGPHPGEATAQATWELRVCEALQEVLCAQACPTMTRSIDTARRCQSVTVQVPDPLLLAEITEKQSKSTSQKAIAALEMSKQSVPLVTQTVMKNVDVEVEKDVTLPPVFSAQEAASVAEFITRSVMMHQHLWAVLLAPIPEEVAPPVAGTAAVQWERPAAHVPLTAIVESLSPIFLPPLSQFYSELLQSSVAAQRNLYELCRTEREAMFANEWRRTMQQTSAKEADERHALQDAAAQAEALDRSAALSPQQCSHVERAYELRVEDVLQHNSRVVRGIPAGGAGPDVTPAAPPEVAPITVSPGDRSRKSKSGPRASASPAVVLPAFSADSAATVTLAPNAAFAIADIETRVERVTTTVEDSNGDSGAPTVSQRHGSRKR